MSKRRKWALKRQHPEDFWVIWRYAGYNAESIDIRPFSSIGAPRLMKEHDWKTYIIPSWLYIT